MAYLDWGRQRRGSRRLRWVQDRDDEECEDVEEDQAQEAGSAAGQEPGWGCQ